MSYKKVTINQNYLVYRVGIENPQASTLAYNAIISKLYVKEWNLITDLLKIYDCPDNIKPDGIIVLCEHDDNPIGVAVQMNWNHREFFVKGIYRRNGIGEKMNRILNDSLVNNKKVYGKQGGKNCVKFFEKINLKMVQYE